MPLRSMVFLTVAIWLRYGTMTPTVSVGLKVSLFWRYMVMTMAAMTSASAWLTLSEGDFSGASTAMNATRLVPSIRSSPLPPPLYAGSVRSWCGSGTAVSLPA